MSVIVPLDLNWNSKIDLARKTEFRSQDVEVLLDQAADLLDRILRDQAEFDELGEKLFEVEQLEIEADAFDNLLDPLPSNVAQTPEPPPADPPIVHHKYQVKDAPYLAADEDAKAIGEQIPSFQKQVASYKVLEKHFDTNGISTSADLGGDGCRRGGQRGEYR